MSRQLFQTLLRVLGATSICFVLSTGLAQAQEFRSTLTGQVTDPSGAVIPGATITALKNNTNQTYKAKTNGSGVYYIPYMLPGLYTVSVRAEGFTTHVQGNVLLQSSQTFGLNFKLQVGMATQEVTVTTAPPLLETASGSGGTIISGRELETTPLNGRQIYMLIGTTPGSQFLQTQFGASGYSGTRGWDVSNNYSLGGGIAGYNMWELNGTNITEMGGFGEEGTWMIAPNADAVQEVNIMTYPYDARYGHSMGGIYSTMTKAGTNRFHGDAYEYLENGAFDANNFESNYTGIPTANTIQHQYGATFGGPIKKDKVFFFGSFEGYWENIPFTTLTSVPPGYLRPQPGQPVDFTPTGFKIYDPLTTVCKSKGGTVGNCPGNNFARTEFPNDTIPANRIDPTAVALLNLYPLPNTNPGSLENNYIARTPDQYRYYQPMARVDYNSSDRTRWYSFYAWQKGHEFRNSSGFTGPAERGDIHSMRTPTIASEDMTHTFSATMVGDFKLSFTRYYQRFPNGPLSTPTPESISLNMPKIPTAFKDLLPSYSVGDYYPTIIGNSVSTQLNQTIVLNVDFTKIRGAHSFEFGGEVDRWNFADPQDVGSPNGSFSFGDGPTQFNPTKSRGTNDGFGVASMLLGYPTGGSVDWNHTNYETMKEFAIYGQDNWKVTHRLELNIGLRWDVQAGPVDRFNGLNRGMCLTCINPITNDPTYQSNITSSTNLSTWQAAVSNINTAIGSNAGPGFNPGTVYGGILFAGVKGQPRTAYNVDWHAVQPRVGFAYGLNDKTVIRGGWGLISSYGIEGGTRSGFNISTPYITSLNGGATPSDFFLSGTPYPNGAIEPVGSSLGLETNLGNGQSLDFPQRKIPYAVIMSFGFQRALPGHAVLDVTYGANYGHALRTQGFRRWINADWPLNWGYPDLQQGTYDTPDGHGGTIGGDIASALNAQVPNPYFGVVPAASSLGSHSTVSASNLLVPFNQFGGALGNYTDPFGKSWFRSLQVKLNKRLYGAGRGMTLQLAYTWSKNWDKTTYRNGWPWEDPRPIYQPIGYDRTNVFSLTGQWDLPMGRGAKYIFTNPSKFWGGVANDWGLSWTFTDASGTPVGIPNVWYASEHSFVPDGGPTFSQWIYNCGWTPANQVNPKSCYTPIPSWGQGNQPNRVGYLRNPHIPNVDLSVHKQFRLTESKQLQFRWEAFNLMNTPLFPGPDTNTSHAICDPNLTPTKCSRWQGFGTVNMFQQNFPRIMQLSLKLFF